MHTSSFNLRTEAELARLRPDFIRWLDRWRWTHFVTLATNDQGGRLRPQRLYYFLREWDARVNRRLFGPKWSRRPDQRLFAAYFLEKPAVNPHWHALIMLDDPDPAVRLRQARELRIEGMRAWRPLRQSGTFDIREVDLRRGVEKYVTKELGYMVQYEHFVAPRQFDSTAQ